MYAIKTLSLFLIEIFVLNLSISFLPLVLCDDSASTTDSSATSTESGSSNRTSYCYTSRSSCSFQVDLDGISEDSCTLVKYKNNSSDCMSSSFKGQVDPDESFGKVLITPYIKFENYAYVGFNVSFTDIKWKRARLRFYESGSKTPAICREFHISGDLFPSISYNTTLFYDCLWSTEEIQSKTYHFQYIAFPADDEFPPVTHQYVFFVPSVFTLGIYSSDGPRFQVQPDQQKKLELLLIVDVSVLPKLRLHVTTASKIYNITKYRVQLIRALVDDKWLVVNKDISVLPNESYFYYTHDTNYRPGVYNFTVMPLHESCHNGECRVSRAPGIMIVASTETELLIGMVGAVILIPILIAAYFMWRRKIMPVPVGDSMEPPKVLLVYNPDYKSHVSDMIRFCEYLKGCHVKPMLDLFCIPNSDSQNPSIWYCDAFDEADCILIFAPPSGPKSQDIHDMNTFVNLGLIARNQLNLFLSRHKITRVKSFLTLVDNKRLFSVCLPGCDWNKLYKEAKYFKRFNLPDEVDDLLKAMGVPGQCSQLPKLKQALISEIITQPIALDGPAIGNVLAPEPDAVVNIDADEVSSTEDNDDDNSECEDPVFNRINWNGAENVVHNPIEETELPRSNSSDNLIDDPTKWYRDAFRQADFILVFASPPGPKSSEPHKCNPYLHLDRIALNQLRLMLAVPGPSCRVVSVLLPGGSWDTLPAEASRLRQFTLPRDLDPLLVCLGAAPQCDGGEGLREALANDVRPDTQPEQSHLHSSRKCTSNRRDESQTQYTELSRMGTRNKTSEPEVQHRPRRDDTLLDIGDLNLSGGC